MKKKGLGYLPRKRDFTNRYALLVRLVCLLLLIVGHQEYTWASKEGAGQQPLQKTITGNVKDSQSMPLPGVSIIIKGTTTGTVTDANGNFSLKVPDDTRILVFSFVGMKTREIEITGKKSVHVVLQDENIGIEDVVVVGYGIQKKESVVGAIAVAGSETLERRGGVTNVSSALSGQIPGVTVLETTGQPGANDPTILIRGMSTWNNATPLILVDGVERRMNDLDVGEVESVSVLKDASATAVFGVKGANGVILITTKRGREGKANLTLSANMGIQTISKVFSVMDSFDGISWKNAAIEHEVSVQESAWQFYTPYETLLRYKRPQQSPYDYLYPNVNWKDEILKDYATTYRVNMNVSGGTRKTKYFGSLAYVHEGDILNSSYNHEKDYNPGYSYNRLNIRGNLDFELTRSTSLAVNMSGFIGSQRQTQMQSTSLGHIYGAIYTLPPDVFPVRYDDGIYGRNINDTGIHNPIMMLNDVGVARNNRSQITSDVKMTQKLDVITKGLSASAHVSYDVYFRTSGPSIVDGGNTGQSLFKYISPAILDAKTKQDSINAIYYITTTGSTGINEFDYVFQPWTISPESVNNNSLSRELFYQASLNYARRFGRHDVSALALFNRREFASGPEFKHYAEDWVGRVTYNYEEKYLLELNGAYNGSAEFSPKYRFGFFPSVAMGWMLSNETFLKYDWLDKLKIRGSYGKVGNDSNIPRWAYLGSWVYGAKSPSAAQARFGRPYLMDVNSPYTFYWEGNIPNPEIHWETAIKKNIGFELSIFKNSIGLNVDVFRDDRKEIFLSGNQRSVPVLFGASPVAVNAGRTKTTGYEVELSLNKTFRNNWTGWSKLSLTHAEDMVIYMEDPEMLPAYQKDAGYAYGQTRTTIREGFMNNWDEAYAGAGGVDNKYRLPGDWALIDYNADGIINNYDEVPFGYPDRPQNTYSAEFGIKNRRFSLMLQFYGVNNINRVVSQGWPTTNFARVPENYGNYWTPSNTGAFVKAPRIATGSPNGDFTVYDGSYLRLKTAEIAYLLPREWTSALGLSSLRVYVNGNNLFFWSDLPQDGETGSFNVAEGYPMFRQYNVGVNVGF